MANILLNYKKYQWMKTVLGPRLQNIFMLNSAEHEIFNAHQYKNIKHFSFFQAQISLDAFFPAHNVKMPTIVGILIFMSRKNFMLS